MIRFEALSKVVPVLMLAVALVACEKDTPDGKVPAKFVSDAQASAGTYVGVMEGQNAKITLSVANDGTAKMTYTDSDGDIVGKNCNTHIGALRSINGKKNDFWGATFALQTSCNIEGSSVYIEMKKNGGLTASIIESSYTTSSYQCHGSSHVCDGEGHCYSEPNCDWQTDTHYTYLSGKFTHQ